MDQKQIPKSAPDWIMPLYQVSLRVGLQLHLIIINVTNYQPKIYINNSETKPPKIETSSPICLILLVFPHAVFLDLPYVLRTPNELAPDDFTTINPI